MQLFIPQLTSINNNAGSEILTYLHVDPVSLDQLAVQSCLMQLHKAKKPPYHTKIKTSPASALHKK